MHTEADRGLAAEDLRKIPQVVRVGCALAIVAFAMFWVLDSFVATDTRDLKIARTWLIGLHLVVFALTYWRGFVRRFAWPLLVSLYFTIGFGVIAVTYLAGGGATRYHEALILLFFAFPLIAPVRPRWFIPPMIVVVIAYFATMSIGGRTGTTAEWATNNFVLWLAVITASAGITLSYRFRLQRFMSQLALEEANVRIAEHAAARGKFFANVSHELRTPLTLIIGPAEQLHAEAGPQQRAIGTILNNGKRLLRLIDDLLALAQSDRSDLALNTKVVDLSRLCERVVENASFGAKSGMRHLEFSHSKEVAFVMGDAHRLEMILTNLVGNALKYTREGDTIVVDCSAEQDRVVVSVRDTGPGMSPEIAERIFERFVQAEGSAGGVGIGLSLVKELVELHGGEVGVSSAPGAGATFSFWLPKEDVHGSPDAGSESYLPVAEKPPSIAPAAHISTIPPADRDQTILVVDDEIELRQWVCKLLSKRYKIVEASDGVEALEKCKVLVPDLVLSDVMMPRMRGTSLCSAIRADKTLRDIPVVLMTAKGDASSESAAMRAGANDYVHKPFHPDVLAARVGVHLRVRDLMRTMMRRENAASLGTLAGGILHEVRNPMQVIKGSLDVLVPQTATQEKLRDHAKDATQRILALCDAMSTQARPVAGETVGEFGLYKVLQSSVYLATRLRKDLEVTVECPEMAVAIGRAAELGSVFLNLTDNAAKSGATEMRIRVEGHGEPTVNIYFEDNGPGVPADVRRKIWAPFFTTRDVGVGTGLGLFMARTIVEASHGSIDLLSSEKGALFRISLGGTVARSRVG